MFATSKWVKMLSSTGIDKIWFNFNLTTVSRFWITIPNKKNAIPIWEIEWISNIPMLLNDSQAHKNIIWLSGRHLKVPNILIT